MSEPAAKSPLQAFSGALSTLVAGAAASVVALRSQHARSSGIVWRPGLIVTADEALPEDGPGDGEMTVVLPGGATAPALLVGHDPTTDIALLRVDSEALRPATLTSGPVTVGEIAVVVGAQDGGPTAAVGVVSLAGGGWRSLRGGEIDARLELAVALRRSAEGGVVVNATGGVIGMAVHGPRRQVLVIPSATIERVAARLQSHGRIARGYLGLGLQPVGLDDGNTGIMVMGVDARGPGAEAGIRQGDVIVAWNGQPIESLRTLLRALTPESIGTAASLSLLRAGGTRDGTRHDRRKTPFLSSDGLNEDRAAEPIVIAVDIGEPGLADRLRALLAETPGLRLAEPGEAADAVLVSPDLQAPPGREPDSNLTQRELEVLALLAEGASNKTVARRLGISVHTAKFHVGSLIDKLEATGRTDAVAHAARLGVINL